MNGARPHFAACQARRGMIFVTTLGVLLIISGLLLVFAQNMRTEALASANRRSAVQAEAVELGAEQWVLANVDAYPGDAVTITSQTAQAMPVGDGYFWLISPDDQTNTQYDYGIVDEQGKININYANGSKPWDLYGNGPQLQYLPGITPDVADAIQDWCNPATSSTGDGAESDYYESLPEPYDCKNTAFESVEELLLVRGIAASNGTPDLLWNLDRNHNGVIDPGETAAGGNLTMFSSGQDTSRGFFRDVTCWTTIAPPVVPGRVIIIAGGGTSGSKTGTGSTGGKTGGGSTGAPAKALPARSQININTCGQDALMCLGLSQGDAQTVISARLNNSDTTSTTWVSNAIGAAKFATISDYITTSSSYYSADIVAVSGDGRAFKRVRIVVNGTAIPAAIVYRRDLTALGWPLPTEIRDSLRAGKGLPADQQVQQVQRTPATGS